MPSYSPIIFAQVGFIQTFRFDRLLPPIAKCFPLVSFVTLPNLICVVVNAKCCLPFERVRHQQANAYLIVMWGSPKRCIASSPAFVCASASLKDVFRNTCASFAFAALALTNVPYANAAVAVPRRPRTSFAIPAIRRRERTQREIEAEKERKRVAIEALDVFEERYVNNNDLNWRRVRANVERRRLYSDEDLQNALRWAFSQADDAYTRYLAPGELEGMKDGIDGEMCGVGIVFNAETRGWRRAKRVVIKDVVRNSPAADAGLMRGDEITAIDMANVTSMHVDDATARLLGRNGGKVLVSFVRREKSASPVELSVMLTRRRFEVPTVAHEYVQVPDVGTVAFLQVRDFAANTTAQARRSLRAICRKSVEAIVLDLRNNAGGLVDQAVSFAKLFLPRDRVVVLFVGRDKQVTVEKTRLGWTLRARVRAPDVPIMILVDERTASASELVAAALRDNCRAVLVGNRTFGKGSVQAVVPLSDGAGVAVTVAGYRTPAGRKIADGQGLRPDWFRADLVDDAHSVTQLFHRAPTRRLKWLRGRLEKCVEPDPDIKLFENGARRFLFWKRDR